MRSQRVAICRDSGGRTSSSRGEASSDRICARTAGSRSRASCSAGDSRASSAKLSRSAKGFSEVVRPRISPTGRPATCAESGSPAAREARTPSISRRQRCGS